MVGKADAEKLNTTLRGEVIQLRWTQDFGQVAKIGSCS